MNNLPQERYAINKAGVAPAAGGVNTYFDKPTLQLGAYSNLENIRLHGAAIEMRGGVTPHNPTAETTTINSLFSYKCDRNGALSFFAQLDDGDVLLADEHPPAVSVGDFGDIVMDYSGLQGESSGSVLPASWSKNDDTVLHSSGGTQHIAWPGPDASPIAAFWKNSSAALGRVLEGGVDLTQVLTDNENSGETATYTYTIANNDGLYICCPYKSTQFDIDMGTVVADGTTTAKIQYFDGDGFTDATTVTDNTTGLQSDGTFSFTTGADERATYMFGMSGYWYRLYLSASVEPTETVRFSEISYTADWQVLENVMDLFDYPIIEAQVEGDNGEFTTFAASLVTVSLLTAGNYIYFATTDQTWAVNINVGSQPNTTASSDISEVQHWTNAGGWAAVTNLEDGTNGLFNTGTVSWDRVESDKQAFQGSTSHVYWYRFKLDQDCTDSCSFAIYALSFFDIDDLGSTGLISTSWKDRGVFSFGKFPRDLHVSRKGRPNILNGDDYAILSPGDGRRNPSVAAVSFHNEMMVWQEEQGTQGGCLTVFEGYSPSTYGKLIVSTRLGTFSQKSVCVLDGGLLTTRTDETVQTMVFFISHYGVFMSDGRVCRLISGDIQNYFDTSYAECITRGQELKMWIGIDYSKKVLRLGLVSGTGATKTNVFPVYDLETGQWSFDIYPTGAADTGIYPSCFAEVEGGSGGLFSLQYLGDEYGRVYRSNNLITYDKASTVAAYLTSKTRAEFSNGANLLDLREISLRASANEDYTLTKKIYVNGVLDTGLSETFTMSDAESGLTFRERILEKDNLVFHLSLELSWIDTEAEGNAAPKLYDFIYDIGMETNKG